MTSETNLNIDTGRAAEFLRNHLRQPVVLVGMMGVGKTVVGRRLADRLGLEFRDSDRIVEEKAGRSVSEIFETDGEEKFRHVERNTILEILSGGPCVLATGGGAVMNPETRAAIKTKAVSVWLKLEVRNILTRLEKSDDRPLLKKGDPEKILTELMAARGPFYAMADIHVESGGGKAAETADVVINSLYRHVKKDTV
ncbi:MAG: shikimate kinase [Alphaproteobacteria bacterium]